MPATSAYSHQQARAEFVRNVKNIAARCTDQEREPNAAELRDFELSMAGIEAIDNQRYGVSPNVAGFNKWLRAYGDEAPSGGLPGREDRGPQDDEGNPIRKRAQGRGELWVDSNGREVRMLRPKDQLSDEEDLSFGKAIVGIVTGRWAGAEREKRYMLGSNDSAGGYLLAPELANNVIDLARNKSVCVAAGFGTVPMQTSDMIIAKVGTDPTATWRHEGMAISASDMTVGSINLSAKFLSVLVPVTVELLADAPNAGRIIENSIAQALALELDRAALHGTGASNEPMGIANAPGINTTAVGAPLAFDNLLTAYGQVELQNGAPNAFAMHPTQATQFRKLKDGDGNYLMGHPTIRALNMLVSKQVTAGVIFMGDFTQGFFAMRTNNVTIEILREGTIGTDNFTTQFKVGVRAYLRADVGLARESHFATLTGLT